MDFTAYTPEFFEQQLVDEQQRFDLAKQPIPRYTMQDLREIYSKEELERAHYRLQEFLNYAQFILVRRLQPGWAKQGKNLYLGQCPLPMFQHWFGFICEGRTKQRCTKYTMDGLRYPNRRIFYTWPERTLPKLNTDEKWYIHNHGNGSGNYSTQNNVSYYTSIELKIEESTGHVWCNYSQATVSCVGDITFPTV
jgi:hypothetical protein